MEVHWSQYGKAMRQMSSMFFLHSLKLTNFLFLLCCFSLAESCWMLAGYFFLRHNNFFQVGYWSLCLGRAQHRLTLINWYWNTLINWYWNYKWSDEIQRNVIKQTGSKDNFYWKRLSLVKIWYELNIGLPRFPFKPIKNSYFPDISDMNFILYALVHTPY